MLCGIHCVADKNDNEEGRAPLEYLPRGPRVSSYATGYSFHCAVHAGWIVGCDDRALLVLFDAYVLGNVQ